MNEEVTVYTMSNICQVPVVLFEMVSVRVCVRELKGELGGLVLMFWMA